MIRLCWLLLLGMVLLPSGNSVVLASPGKVYVEETDAGLELVRPVTVTNELSATERDTIQVVRHYHALYTPTDPDWKYQWNLEAINMPAAWEAGASVPFVGSSGIVVAILDTGLAAAPDLASANIWTNPGEIAGDAIDNDSNGFIDDVHGWNFVSGTNTTTDDYGHGTHISDIIAGGINNSLSIAGIAPGTTILPIKVLDSSGQGTTDTITNGIRYALAAGAAVINLSLGGTEHDPLLSAAIADAYAAGILVVAASGNDGGSTLNYPARYEGTISVSASQYDATRAPYANYGSGLTVVAPGGNGDVDQNDDGIKDWIPGQTCIGTPCIDFTTRLIAGTSQAAAHVSGVLALLRACGATGSQAAAALTSTTTDLGPVGYDAGYGYGLVNAQAALTTVGCASTSPSAPANVNVTAGGAAATQLSSTRAWPYNRPAFHWGSASGMTYHISWGKVGKTPSTTTTTRSVFQPTITTAGTYEFSIRAVDGNNYSSPIITRQYYYRPASLIVGTTTKITTYSMLGKQMRSFSAFSNSALGNGSSVNLNAADRIVATDQRRSGVVKIFTGTGALAQSIRVFQPTLKTGISAAFVHQQNLIASLVVASTSVGELRWLDSSGTTLLRKVKNTDRGYRVATGDVDGDANDEVLVVDRAGSTVRLYSASGELLFSVRPRGASYAGGWMPAIGDVTGDGKAEVLVLPVSDQRDPIISVLNGNGKRIKTIKLSGLRTSTAFSFTAGNIDGGPKDRLLVSAGESPVTAWNYDGQKIRTIQLPSVTKVSSLGIWQ